MFAHPTLVNRREAPDFSTVEDKRAEPIIRDLFKLRHPHIGVAGEEGEKEALQTDRYFLVDPCDGTTNFVLGVPYFAVSIAHICENDVVDGVIYAPCEEQLFYAAKNRGASSQSLRSDVIKALHASRESDPRRSLLIAEEAFSCTCAQGQNLTKSVMAASLFAGIRKFGSTALDLAHLATHQPLALIATDLKSWDFAAELIIASEAGASLNPRRGPLHSTK